MTTAADGTAANPEWRDLRATRHALRLQLRDAQRIERAARTALRRTRITDDPSTVTVTQHRYRAAQDAVAAAEEELASIQRALHDAALTRLTHHRVKSPVSAHRSA
jgi:hypothetical protein